MPMLFDSDLRLKRRDRSWRMGPPAFLAERIIEDMVDRLGAMNRRFDRALVVGTLAGPAIDRFKPFAERLDRVDPSALVAGATGAEPRSEDSLDDVGAYDLVIALGTLDTVEALPEALMRFRLLLKPDSPLIGVMSGGETLPLLRQAMHAADNASGRHSPHLHPRIQPAALAGLLAEAGLQMPVVDIDRVRLSYRDLSSLVADLRALGATNVLAERDKRPLGRAALAAAAQAFTSAADDRGRSIETFELLHFLGWTPSDPSML
ncbi:methyltransferase domain-containing protein [Sphingomicrobium aestuariivivum]|uniref:methyltransferase domain-containing protein n=1 Tax=Sphingomicrobium aestuariivivum TaxID=1582356 RepID=UPI001FD68342|nr:SAM-dependent methyltransferase [Sphingomicrobium aestuariivivum]MCJ8191759.1 SAM-dependent methyltransferase [Sphingomicrobium aestuariivivum]